MKQKRKLSRRQAGVTLIEMLVVVTIIALFAALVAPTMLKHGDKARVVAARSQIQNFSTAIGSYKLDTSQYPCYRARPCRSSQSAGRPAKLERSLPAAGRPERPLGSPLTSTNILATMETSPTSRRSVPTANREATASTPTSSVG